MAGGSARGSLVAGRRGRGPSPRAAALVATLVLASLASAAAASDAGGGAGPGPGQPHPARRRRLGQAYGTGDESGRVYSGGDGSPATPAPENDAGSAARSDPRSGGSASPSFPGPYDDNSGSGPGYISPKEYLVALYVIPLWLCLILICLRGTARWSMRRNGVSASLRESTEDGRPGALDPRESARGLNSSALGQLKQYTYRAARPDGPGGGGGLSLSGLGLGSRRSGRVGDQGGAQGQGQGQGGSGAKYETTDCSVCMDAFQEGDKIRELPCGHIFHSECVDEVSERKRASHPLP